MNMFFLSFGRRILLLSGVFCLLIFVGCNSDDHPSAAVVDDATFYSQMDAAGVPEDMLPRDVALTNAEKQTLMDFVGSEDYEALQLSNSHGSRTSTSDVFLFRASVFLTGLTNEVRPEALTAFAPVNAAFINDLGINNLIGLLRRPTTALREVIEYHIVIGAFTAQELSSAFFLTLNGAAIEIGIGREGVTANQANVIAVNFLDRTFFPNGVLHVIDGILIPPTQNIVEIAIAAAPEFSILVEAVVEAGLAETLASEGPFTVFAPTNAAFEELLSSLETHPSVETLQAILLYHVVPGRVYSSDLVDGPVATLGGEIIINTSDFSIDDTGTDVNANLILEAINIQGTNGVIHAIDKVLIP